MQAESEIVNKNKKHTNEHQKRVQVVYALKRQGRPIYGFDHELASFKKRKRQGVNKGTDIKSLLEHAKSAGAALWKSELKDSMD